MAGVRAADLDAESRSVGCSFKPFHIHYDSLPDPSSSPLGSPTGFSRLPGDGADRSAVYGDGTSACLTAFGSCLIMRRSAAAGPLTRRLPCSHFR